LDGADVVLGSQIIAALRYFWYSEGSAAEGLLWVGRALTHEKRLSSVMRAKVSMTASTLYFAQGDHDLEKRFGRKALELAQESGDELTRAWALLAHSKSYYSSQDQVAQGLTLCDESLALFRNLDHMPGIIFALIVLGELSRIFGDYQRAEIDYQECLELSRQSGDKKRIAVSLTCLSSIAMHHGDYMRAEVLQKEALEMVVELGTKYYIGYGLACLSGPLALQGRPAQAAMLLGASESILQALGASLQPADQIEIDRYIATIHEQLDETSVNEALAEGREMSIGQAISFALDEQDS
jgi:tetratricopeptide (TPR) repeat protein